MAQLRNRGSKGVKDVGAGAIQAGSALLSDFVSLLASYH